MNEFICIYLSFSTNGGYLKGEYLSSIFRDRTVWRKDLIDQMEVIKWQV